MPNVIVLTQAERDVVVGPSAINPHAVLDPILLTDGTYYVGVEVMTDVVFAAAKYTTMKSKTPVDFDMVVKPLLPVPNAYPGRP